VTSAPSPRRPGKSTYVSKVFGALASTIFIVALTALLVECAYRYYLNNRVAAELADWNKKFQPSERPSFGVHGVPPWFFDKDVGHSFQQGPWRAAQISDGTFLRCESAGEGNRLGNYGWMPDDYAKADLRLMIVGSSFSMVADENGKLVDRLLMERLSSRLHRSVSVLNYSRDATGVLAYLNMARFKFDESKPHVVIALINAISLIGRPHWRVVLPEDNGFRRLYFLLDPEAQPTDPKRAVPQPFVISDAVTEEWCQGMMLTRARGEERALRQEPLVKALVARYNKLQHDALEPKIAINFWRPDVSFAWNLLTTGDPFDGMVMFSEPIYNALTLDRYTDDARFNTAVKRLKELGVPVIPVHIPQFPDMRQQTDGGWSFAANGLPPRQGASLVADLEAALGEPFVHLYQYYPSELKKDPLKLVVSESNSHPSKLGVAVMAEALERMLLEHPRTARLLKRND
jgi:hypothetical protein